MPAMGGCRPPGEVCASPGSIIGRQEGAVPGLRGCRQPGGAVPALGGYGPSEGAYAGPGRV